MQKCFLYFSVLLGLLSSCKTDFEVNDPWKQENIIYALMTNKDSINTYTLKDSDYLSSVQYFSITKMFSNTGGNAGSIAKISDSLYNKNWVVTLYEFNGSTLSDSFTLITTTSIPRDSGVFAYPYQVLYRTPTGFILKPSRTYKIKVYDTKTKFTSTANTSVVQKIQFQYTPNATYLFRFIPNTSSPITFYSGANAKFYDLTYTIHYWEWPGVDTSNKVEKTIPWPIFRNSLNAGLSGGETVTYGVLGSDFFNRIYNAVPVNPGVHRKIKGIEVSIAGGGDDIYTYISVNSPSIGIVQKKTDYTNINNGYGIFSSRSETKYFLPVNGQTIDTLMLKSPTNTLGFIK